MITRFFQKAIVALILTWTAGSVMAQPPPAPPTWEQANEISYSGQFAKAVELLAGRLVEVPDDAQVTADLLLAIRGAMASEQKDQTLAFLARWAEEPRGSMGHAVLGYGQLMAGMEAEARGTLQKALDAEARASGPALYLKAILQERAGDTDAARDTWRAFLPLSEEGPLADAVRQGWVVIDDRKVVGPNLGLTYPAFSPDGRLLLCSAWKEDGVHIVLFDPTTGRERVLIYGEPGQQLHRPVWSADGKELFYERCIPQEGKWPQRAVLRAPLREGTTGVSVAPGLTGSGTPSLTADGQTLCFEGNEGEVWSVPLKGGEPRLHLKTGGAFRFFRSASPALTCDGKSLVLSGIASDDGAVAVIPPTDTAAPKLIALAPKRLFAFGSLSPDERSYVTSLGEKEGKGFWDVCLCDVSGNTKFQRIAWGRPAWNYRPAWSPDGRQIAYVGRHVEVRVLTLGGLAICPLALNARPQREGLTVSITIRQNKALRVSISFELFDTNSVQVAEGTVGKPDMALKPGEIIECPLPLPAAKQPGIYTLKLTAVTEKGARVVELVDYEVKG